MLLEVDSRGFQDMHESIMSHLGMEHEQHNTSENYDGWVDINNYGGSQQHQSPNHEYSGFGFIPQAAHATPSDPVFSRMQPQQPTHTTQHQQLLPLIMPSHPTWPSMITNPTGFQAPAVPMPPAPAPLKTSKLPALHQPSPRKTLTDDDRRRMCRYHEENPSVKQTEIGAMFGVERSTVSKVLRQKEKYLFPEDRGLSPVKRAGKGKFPDIDRALSNWARNSQKQGIPLTDAVIKDKARFFATTVGSNENHAKANNPNWLEKFKQKNGIGGAKLFRRASETNVSDIGALNLESGTPSASQTPSGVSPTSPPELASPDPLTPSQSQENLMSEVLENYVEFGTQYRHSNSKSSTSLSSTSAFTDTAPSSFSGGPTSPPTGTANTPFGFSPEANTGVFMTSPHSRLPPASFQRPRSQTFPMLGIDPAYTPSAGQDPLTTPKYHNNPQHATAPTSAMEPQSPDDDLPSFGASMDEALSRSLAQSQNISLQHSLSHSVSQSPVLNHRSSNGSMSMLPPSTTTPNMPSSAFSSPPGTSPSSPTQDDARRALDTLLHFFNSAPQGLVDHSEYLTVLGLTQKLRIQQDSGPIMGGLHSIVESDDVGPKNELV